MRTNKKSTNSLQELLEKTKNIVSNIYIPEILTEEADENKILRPYLEPSNFYVKNTQTEIEHKSSTNRTQFEHSPSTIRAQIEHNSSTIRTQFEHDSNTKTYQFEHNSSTESSTESGTKRPIIEPEKTFPSLSKSQKEILIFIHNSCRLCRNKVSPPITLDEFESCCCLNKNSIKTTLRRLEQAHIILLRSFKRGRQGWRRYEITENIYQEILTNESKESNSSTISNTKSSTGTDVVSSKYINNITTTCSTISDSLNLIDFSPLDDVAFGQSHLIQIYREYEKNPNQTLGSDIIQDSINALAFDLKHNKVAESFKQSPAVVLTSLLKKGIPYSSKTPEKFKTPKEEAMHQYLLAQERKNLKNLEIEVRAKELALQDWLSNLSENELSEFSHNYESCPPGMPEKIYQTSKRKKATASAKEYFDTVVWPDKLKKILNEG